jgi:hypothetical protein
MSLFCVFFFLFWENNHYQSEAGQNRRICVARIFLTNFLLKRAPGRDQICLKMTQLSISEAQWTTLWQKFPTPRNANLQLEAVVFSCCNLREKWKHKILHYNISVYFTPFIHEIHGITSCNSNSDAHIWGYMHRFNMQYMVNLEKKANYLIIQCSALNKMLPYLKKYRVGVFNIDKFSR